jgi:hypothetical protein
LVWLVVAWLAFSLTAVAQGLRTHLDSSSNRAAPVLSTGWKALKWLVKNYSATQD